MSQALAIIPARMASTRLPGKPLLCETGKPLIQHVVENAQRADSLTRVVVATDDQVIVDAVEGFGGEAVLTGPHPNGTSRLAEALTLIDSDHELIVNVQGDEPEIDPQVIDALVAGIAADAGAPMATLCSRFAGDEDPTNPNIVKLVRDANGRAMYFSRSLMPFDRDHGGVSATPQTAYWKHPGLYAYRRDFLANVYPTLPPTPLEDIEKLEQLRILEHGCPIAVIEANAPEPGIDTSEQYTAFVERYQKHSPKD
ncbi:MAG: 3-deoxy-manno-octulosonate cytidylyltransferase [Phycisphaeraceae bacterium]|nr:3-deoxy-manno-octulosonate cytidylyltransferase [Phycisphaeraceae bacterium]